MKETKGKAVKNRPNDYDRAKRSSIKERQSEKGNKINRKKKKGEKT